MSKHTTLWFPVISLVAALLLNALPSTAEGASGRGKERKAVSKEHMAKLQKRSIARKERRLQQLTTRIDGMVATIRDFQNRNAGDLMADKQVNARMHALAKQQGQLKRELATLRDQSLQQYAATRGIPLIPAPPQTAPPPLPDGPPPNPGQLTVPSQAPQPAKATLPPGGATVIKTQPPQI